MSMRLHKLTAIVTGAGTGIGQGIAIAFAKEGAQIVVAGRRKEPLEQTVAQIQKAGGVARAVVCDVSVNTQVEALVKEAVEIFGGVDILVNNAGVYRAHDALTMTDEEWDSVMSIDLKGVWYCSKAVIPQMLAKKRGKIIHISSIAGLIGFEQSAAYCAAKGAVINLTREMALDYAPRGIFVNGIAPGVIASDMTNPMLQNDAVKNDFLAKTPVGRIGTPEDIAHAAVFLASSESDFIVGQTIVVDGGWTIR
jgi:NAD(P)-dependent dehydrogenase (short-subunit alcohol dehydrogenase family)